MMYERTILKIERRTSPNGRYDFTLSFLCNGCWNPANYAHSAKDLREWAIDAIERGNFAGPIIEPGDAEKEQPGWAMEQIQEAHRRLTTFGVGHPWLPLPARIGILLKEVRKLCQVKEVTQ